MVVAGMYTLNLDQVVLVVWVFVWSGASSQAKDDPEINVGSPSSSSHVSTSLVHTQVHVGTVARPMYLAEKREDTIHCRVNINKFAIHKICKTPRL